MTLILQELHQWKTLTTFLQSSKPTSWVAKDIKEKKKCEWFFSSNMGRGVESFLSSLKLSRNEFEGYILFFSLGKYQFLYFIFKNSCYSLRKVMSSDILFSVQSSLSKIWSKVAIFLQWMCFTIWKLFLPVSCVVGYENLLSISSTSENISSLCVSCFKVLLIY